MTCCSAHAEAQQVAALDVTPHRLYLVSAFMVCSCYKFSSTSAGCSLLIHAACHHCPQAAESAAQELLRAVRPVGLPSAISLPATRLLADVQLCLADLHLQLAREQRRHAAADRAAQRPEFPVVGAKDAAAVTRFVDEVDAEVSAGAPPLDICYRGRPFCSTQEQKSKCNKPMCATSSQKLINVPAQHLL
jgi:hypothetical protein